MSYKATRLDGLAVATLIQSLAPVRVPTSTLMRFLGKKKKKKNVKDFVSLTPLREKKKKNRTAFLSSRCIIVYSSVIIEVLSTARRHSLCKAYNVEQMVRLLLTWAYVTPMTSPREHNIRDAEKRVGILP